MLLLDFQLHKLTVTPDRADALMKMVPSNEWDFGALADQAIYKRGGSQYKLEQWLATSGKWPPCGRPKLDKLIEDI